MQIKDLISCNFLNFSIYESINGNINISSNSSGSKIVLPCNIFSFIAQQACMYVEYKFEGILSAL